MTSGCRLLRTNIQIHPDPCLETTRIARVLDRMLVIHFDDLSANSCSFDKGDLAAGFA
jgi:hypothetical protein